MKEISIVKVLECDDYKTLMALANNAVNESLKENHEFLATMIKIKCVAFIGLMIGLELGEVGQGTIVDTDDLLEYIKDSLTELFPADSMSLSLSDHMNNIISHCEDIVSRGHTFGIAKEEIETIAETRLDEKCDRYKILNISSCVLYGTDLLKITIHYTDDLRELKQCH